jgi:hypothetical protein
MPQDNLTRHRVHIAGRWEIRDLYEFPHRYAEVYSFLFALEPSGTGKAAIAEAFRRYPWRGGYSTVNFYDEIYLAIPREYRPQITEIRYASPGWIELGMLAYLVFQIDEIIGKVCHGIERIDKLYGEIRAHALQRKLLSLAVKERERQLAKQDLEFVKEAFHILTEEIGLKNASKLANLSGDPLGALKMLMAFYRRVRQLAGFVISGKVKLSPIDRDRVNFPLNE